MIGSSISMDEAIWASIPAFLGMDAGWNTTTSLHTYHRNGQDLQHQIFGARNSKSTGATCCPAWTPAAVVSKPFHAECGRFCKTCSEFQERMAKMQHTRYTVYSIHMITCIVYVGTLIIIIYHCSMQYPVLHGWLSRNGCLSPSPALSPTKSVECVCPVSYILPVHQNLDSYSCLNSWPGSRFSVPCFGVNSPPSKSGIFRKKIKTSWWPLLLEGGWNSVGRPKWPWPRTARNGGRPHRIDHLLAMIVGISLETVESFEPREISFKQNNCKSRVT